MSASVRHRYIAYSDHLLKNSINLIVLPLFSDRYFQIKILNAGSAWGEVISGYIKRFFQVLFMAKPSCVIVHTEMTPYLPDLFELILRLRNIPYIIDIDDALFHQYDKHPNIIVRYLLKNKIGRIMKHSAFVFAGNKYIANYARSWNAKNVEIVPTVIDMVRYTQNVDIVKNDIFTIVWVGSPSTTQYLIDILPALVTVCKAGKAKLQLIGAKTIQLPKELELVTEFLPWSEESEVELLRKCHVGIMPLPDTDWERGKCGFKLIQYMGCNLPVIASPVGVNSEIVINTENGFLATSVQEWTKALVKLRDNPHLVSYMGYKGRNKAESEYSLQVWSKRYIELVNKVLSNKS